MKRLFIFSLFIYLSVVSFSQNDYAFNQISNSTQDSKEIQPPPESKQDSIYYIKYGKSSAKCSGYCFLEYIVDFNNIFSTNKSMQDEKKYPVKIDTSKTTSAHWDRLVKSIDINYFFSIPQKAGNHGAHGEYTPFSEWIEINYGGNIHRVTFDGLSPNEYQGVQTLLKLLKQYCPRPC